MTFVCYAKVIRCFFVGLKFLVVEFLLPVIRWISFSLVKMQYLTIFPSRFMGPAVQCLMVVLLLFMPNGSQAMVNSPVEQARELFAEGPLLPPLLRFEHLTADDGLSQDSVIRVFQDRQGFLWLGTQDGLNRYDGYRFTVFRNDSANENSLSHNFVISLAQDAEGMLWVGTLGGGLNRYDPSSGVFARYLHNNDQPGSLSSNTVTALHVDAQGRLWAGTQGGGLNLFDAQANVFRHYRADPTRPDALISDNIASIVSGPDGFLWIGTGGFGVEGEGLDRFDPQTGQATHYRYESDDTNTISSNTISALAVDANGVLWVGTGGYNVQGSGLNRLDTRTGQVTRFLYDAEDPTSLGSNDVMSLMLDTSGALWIGTWGRGVDRLDPNMGSPGFLHYRNDPYDRFSMSSNNIWSIWQDRTGVLWFGAAAGGLNKINPFVQRFQLYRNNPGQPLSLAGNSIGPLVEDLQGNVWVGTYGFGLDRYVPKSATFGHYVNYENNPFNERANTYTALFIDRYGDLWVGTPDGLAQFNPATGIFARYYYVLQQTDDLSTHQVNDLIEDAGGRLWVSTNNGLDWFDRQNQRFIHMEIPEAGPGTDLFLERPDTLWFGTQGTGLFRLDLKTVDLNKVTYTRFQSMDDQLSSLGDNTILHINKDQNGELWFATGRGLDHFDSKTQKFTHYRVEDGLSSNNVYCILVDDQNRLWVSSNAGITRYDPSLAEFRTFDARDGLQGNEFRPRSCLRARDGTMYFGGVSGISAYKPEEIQNNPFPPPVAVTGFRIYNQPVAADLSGKTEIQLAYRQDFVTFEFVALDFHIPQKNELLYKLDGMDKDWVRADFGRYASYTNLPSGSYVFRVRGSNNDGVWNEDAVAIPIYVAAPFWETRWFQICGSIFLILAVFLGIQAYLMNVNVQNRRLEELVTHRTTSLRQANERLQEEIEQREKAEAALAQKAAEEAVIAERSRLARDLHDAVTQTLFSASITAEVLPDLWTVDPGEARRSTEDLRHLTRGALAEMRTLLLELRPAALTQARFEDLLRQLTDAVIGRTRLSVDLNASGQRSFPPDVQVALYRISQEALNNIVKHARATRVCIDLQMSPAGLLLSIRDNGVGFDAAAVRPTSMGMRIMRERAEGIGADLTILSQPGKGTLVEVNWNENKTKELG